MQLLGHVLSCLADLRGDSRFSCCRRGECQLDHCGMFSALHSHVLDQCSFRSLRSFPVVRTASQELPFLPVAPQEQSWLRCSLVEDGTGDSRTNIHGICCLDRMKPILSSICFQWNYMSVWIYLLRQATGTDYKQGRAGIQTTSQKSCGITTFWQFRPRCIKHHQIMIQNISMRTYIKLPQSKINMNNDSMMWTWSISFRGG